MVVTDINGHKIIVPFKYYNGLTIMPHSMPTEEDLKKLPIVDISDPEREWRP